MPDGLFGRALQVLSCFSEERIELGAAELVELTGLPPSTLHRLLARLVAEQLLMRVPGRRYSIGVRLYELGELSPVSVRLRETAIPHLMRLYEATHENVHLAVLDGANPAAASALMVGRVTGRDAIPTVSRAGGRNPLHATGVGKALLATRDEAWLAEYFRAPLLPETRHTITSEAELRRQIVQARRRHYAMTREEMTLGNVSIAAQLPAVPGLPPTAIGVVVRIEDADERQLVALVRWAVGELVAELRRD